MLAYILRRLLIAVGTVWVISMVSFVIIQLPPGDYVTSYIAQLMSTGSLVTQEEAENLRAQYGLDRPVYVQYAKWMWLVLHGNFGVSMEWKRPVTEVIGDRLLLTALLAFTAVIFTVDPGDSDWHLLGGTAVFRRGLCRHLHGIHWPGCA